MLPEEIEDHEVLAEWLTEKRGARVYIRVPQKGMKEKLVELAQKKCRACTFPGSREDQTRGGKNHRRDERDRASSGDGGTFPRGGI